MILSSADIKKYIASGDIRINPFIPENLKPGSYTFTLGSKLFKLKLKDFINTREEKIEYDEIEMTNDGYLLNPGEFIVGLVGEKVGLSEKVLGILGVRGCRAQAGLDALQSDQIEEPGYEGYLRLAMSNTGPIPIMLYPGIKIVKGVFFRVGVSDD